MPAAPEAPARTAGPVQVQAPKLRRAKAAATHEYWMGTLPDSPRSGYAVGGVDFNRYAGNVSFGEDGQPDHPITIGERKQLTEEQVEKIKSEIVHYVVRRRGAASENQPWKSGEKADVLDVRGGDEKFAPRGADMKPVLTYRAPASNEDPDVPFGNFVFLYPVVDGVPLPEHPEPMIARS